ncbi:glycine-rich RNA-binding protein RZ1B isoform X1 [Papilio machaon]|uniref:glycine-rich RNA-binding protein RZ1B isoform X1 n=1 Tax=Papilio machaon TaxID=76193 RepID=UPI001E665241|nr:glycine-rich RNA-binding protein RZ1B isoform X1 [Papilio machaon]
MEQIIILILSSILLISTQFQKTIADGSILSAILTPTESATLQRQERSYYERYGARRPLYDRLDYDSRCGRCDDRYDDRNDDRDDYDRGRDRYDDDRRSNRPTSGNRHDQKDYDDDDRSYSNDRKNGHKNGTEDENDTDKKRPHDDKDRPSSGRKGNRDRHRHEDRDRYRPDYYDRFLRDPYRHERPYYDDPYRERRPYDRYNPYSDRFDDGYGGRYDGYAYNGYRRPYYDDRYDRGGAYDAYGGYGPSVGRGPHDSFRPWDETYRGQSGWDAGGRGYYFASGRPDNAQSQYWGRPEYSRPQSSSSGWQGVGYSSGYRDPALDYRGSFGYGQTGGYRQDVSSYGQSSGWQSVGERRPYRDQSGVSQLDNSNPDSRYGQPVYGQQNGFQPNSYGVSSTTLATSYLYEREGDNIVTAKPDDNTTKPPS